VTRRDVFGAGGALTVRALIRRSPIVALPSWTLRDAADAMVRESVGRLPVVAARASPTVVGIITRSDLLRAHATRLDDLQQRDASIVSVWRRSMRARPAVEPPGS